MNRCHWESEFDKMESCTFDARKIYYSPESMSTRLKHVAPGAHMLILEKMEESMTLAAGPNLPCGVQTVVQVLGMN
jgi:hypothetical protein